MAGEEKRVLEQLEQVSLQQSFRQSNTKAGLPAKLYKQERNPYRAQIGAIKNQCESAKATTGFRSNVGQIISALHL